MAKYIDADLLRKEIERLKNEDYGDGYLADDIATCALNEVLSFIESQEKVQPQGLDEAAEEYAFEKEEPLADGERLSCKFNSNLDAFKAGAKWRDSQMKMPNSTELIVEWRNVKDILKEKDFRGDEWRLAYQAFMFGFSRGINTTK